MIKAADILFLPAAFVAAVATQLGMGYGMAALSITPHLYTFETLVALVMLAFTCWRDFLGCRTGHAARWLIAPLIAGGMTWASMIPALLVHCMIVGECL